MRCNAFTFVGDLANERSSAFQFELAQKAPTIMLSSSILSGSMLGKRVLPPVE